MDVPLASLCMNEARLAAIAILTTSSAGSFCQEIERIN